MKTTLDLQLILELDDAKFNQTLESIKVDFQPPTNKFKELVVSRLNIYLKDSHFGRALRICKIYTILVPPSDQSSFRFTYALVSHLFGKSIEKKFWKMISDLVIFSKKNCSSAWVQKLESVKNYSNIWRQLAFAENDFVNMVFINRPYLIREFIAWSERSYLPAVVATNFNGLFSEEHTSSESMSSAASVLLNRYRKLIKSKRKLVFSLVTEAHPEHIDKMFVFLNTVRTLIEYGVKICYFDTECKLENKKFRLHSLDEKSDIALSFGYAMRSLHEVNDSLAFYKSHREKAVELETFIIQSLEQLKFIETELVSTPNGQALKTVINVGYVKHLMGTVAESGSLFLEELMHLSFLCSEMHTNPEELYKFKIKDNLQLYDILLIFRILKIYAYARNSSVMKLCKTNMVSFINSLVIHNQSIDDYKNVLLEFGFKKETINDFIDLMSCDMQSDDIIDLQYNPYIKFDNEFYFLPNTLLQSNFFRNALQSSKKRLNGKNSKYKLEEILESSIVNSGGKAKTNVEYHYKGESGEIDLVFQLNGSVFFFECKDCMLPTNAFEQRSYFEQIEKGTSQLKTISGLVTDPDFLTYLSNKIGWQIDKSHTFGFSVITGNRLLSGAAKNEIPIRSFSEMLRLIENGHVTVGVANIFESLSLWRGQNLTDEDVHNYLSHNSILYSAIWKNTQKVVKEIAFGSFSLTYDTYGFSLHHVAEDLGASQNMVEKMKESMEYFTRAG